jgi:CDGSH-type Zn-finger protein
MATEFHIIKNGPVKVTGNFILTGSDGKQIHIDNEVFLCRCGGSKNKPFCDNTHQSNHFCG